MSIDYAQGYWMERPRPVSEVFGAQAAAVQPLLQLANSDWLID